MRVWEIYQKEETEKEVSKNHKNFKECDGKKTFF